MLKKVHDPRANALQNVHRILTEEGSVTRRKITLRLSRQQRPHADFALETLESRGVISSVKVDRGVRFTLIGEPYEGPIREWGTPPSDTYMAVHTRLRRNRGRASSFTCEWCPKAAQAWAYDGLDSEELQGETKHGRGDLRTYSAKLEHYLPLCWSCHNKFDSC